MYDLKRMNGNFSNQKYNLISGPRPTDYWFHYGSALEVPEYREEGAFPVQGNIGELLKQEANGNYAFCGRNDGNNVSGSPSCSGVFNPDIYTFNDTCGENCLMNGPESYGIQNFGMINNTPTPNIHALHAYSNILAATDGQQSNDLYGCYEWVPGMKKVGDTCMLDYSTFESNTVGDWTKVHNMHFME